MILATSHAVNTKFLHKAFRNFLPTGAPPLEGDVGMRGL